MKFKLGILFGLLFTLFSCQETVQPGFNLEQAIPSNTVWMLEINDWTDLKTKLASNKAYNQIRALESMASFDKYIEELSNQFGANELDNFLQTSETYLLSTLSGADRYDWLVLTKSLASAAQSLFQNLQAQLPSEAREYSGQKVYEFQLGERALFLLQKDELTMISGSRLCLEAAIRQLQSETQINALQELNKVRQTRNQEALANLYLNLKSADDYLSSFKNNSLKLLANQGSWLSLDIEAEVQDLIATGLIEQSSDQSYYPEIFQELRAENIQAQAIVPQNIAQWVHLSIGNIGQYERAFQNYLEQNGLWQSHLSRIDKLPSGLQSSLSSIIDNEMGSFEAGRNNERSFHFAYFSFRDAEAAQENLENFADSSYIEGYRGLILRKLKAQNVLARLYGEVFSEVHHPYYTLHQNYVLFCDDLAALKVLVNDILDNKTLDRLESYQNLQNQLPGKAHIQIVIGMPEWLANRKGDLKSNYQKELESRQDSLGLIRWGILQLKSAQDRSFISTILREEKPLEEKIVRQWSTQLGNPLEGAPQFLKNHSNQKLDIAVQDEEDKLYLISRKGEVYWEKELDGPIMGEIKQLDIFKNNKLQMVFNTEASLYVVDRLGRDVEGFPVKLPESASAPLGLFNYDQARNYRLVVPCGPKLYNYDVEGKLVKGWNFKKAASDIVSEPQHFSVAGKDIIVCLSAEGKLYQLNRRGEERFVLEEEIEELKTSFYLKQGESLKESELIAGSNSGKMYVINPQGQVDAIYLDESHPADHLIYFQNRYIFSDDESLFVKDDQKPFSASLEDDISLKPKAMILNNRFYVAAFSAKAEEIRLFNEEGQLVDGFPVFAQGPFDMGSLNRDQSLNIVTYSNDGTLICYRLR